MLAEPEPVSEVIDSSAVTKYSTKEDGWRIVESHMIVADSLELAIKETGNALWKKMRRKEIELETAKTIVRTLTETLWILDQKKYIQRALEIANEYDISIYDALFVACAEIEKSKLVSCDARQLEVALKLGIETVRV